MATSIAPLALARLTLGVAEACDGVAAVSPGSSGVAATHGPGGKVPGVVVRRHAPGGATVAVHIVAGFDRSLPAVADTVRAEVRAALDRADPEVAPWRVDVHVADLVVIPPGPDGPDR